VASRLPCRLDHHRISRAGFLTGLPGRTRTSAQTHDQLIDRPGRYLSTGQVLRSSPSRPLGKVERSRRGLRTASRGTAAQPADAANDTDTASVIVTL
jgi:hypothetical protein